MWVHPRLEEKARRQLTENKDFYLIDEEEEKEKGLRVTRRDEDGRGFFPDESYDFVEQVINRLKSKLSDQRDTHHVLGWFYT